MFGYSNRTFRLAKELAVILTIFNIFISTDAVLKCHKCNGINCLRTSYTATEDCIDTLDSCVTVFQGSTVLAQGCLGQLAVELRRKCETMMTDKKDADITENEEASKSTNPDCYQCRENSCNNVSGDGFECIQCDSNMDANCASNTENLQLKKCPIARSTNSYCYAKMEDKRIIRGCATDLMQQKECLNNKDCMLCSPLDIGGCNREPKIALDSTGSGSGSSGGGGTSSGDGSGAGEGGGAGSNGSGSSSGEGGSNSGNGGGGTASGGSGSGEGGSSSGNGGGGTGSGGSGGSGTGDGGSNSSGGDGNTTNSGNNNISSANTISNYKLIGTYIFILVVYFIS